MTTRTRYTATYLYPGVFMPEETTVDLPEATWSAAQVYAPDEPGYFAAGGWFAVIIKTITEKKFFADDGEEMWVPGGKAKTERIIIGTEVRVDDPSIADDRFRILRSNIQYNSRDPYRNLAVHTRSGNWQIRSDWDRVVADA